MGICSFLFTFLTLFLLVSSFGGSEDRFLKKYAMMKIYESCFGPDVVKQIRREMKLACDKCAALQNGQNTQSQASALPSPPQNLPSSDSFDIEKFQQAILAYRPNPPQNGYRPYGPSGFAPFYNQPYNPGYQSSLFYPGFPIQANQFSQYGAFPMIGQPLFGNRVSREMEIKSRFDDLTSQMSGRVRNVTCVMQELGYLDDNLEPNFHRISERISNLPVADDLKHDMQEGVQFCQQFSQCVPDVKKDKSPLSQELLKPMFFFKCYKHKKLEACILKDVREKYAGVTGEEFEGIDGRRTGKMSKEEEIEDLTAHMYQFLYGSDIDTLF